MFRPNWPSSGVRVVMVKHSAAHYNAIFLSPIVHEMPPVILVKWVARGCCSAMCDALC
jgi:hypothetical protein